MREIELDSLTDEDVVSELMEELRAFSPGAAKALLDERDAYIAGNLLNLHFRSKERTCTKKGEEHSLTKECTNKEGEGRKIVAVVGAGHVAGIKRLLAHPELIPPRSELVSLPKKRFSGRFSIKHLLGVGMGVALVIILLAVFFSGFSLDTLLRAFLYWVLINGVLSASGVVVARGHPLSAVTAFSVAWLTSLNPFLAAGWFAGLAEAHFRKPRVEDAKGMLSVESLRELARNRLFKTILVAALANLGSIAGTFIGIGVVGHELGINVQEIWEGLRALIF